MTYTIHVLFPIMLSVDNNARVHLDMFSYAFYYVLL